MATSIINSEAVTNTTMGEVQAWMTSNSIPINGSISLSVDDVGFVKQLDTAVTFTAQQIIDFKQVFFNKRFQGNVGGSVTSASNITLGNGNLFRITGTSTISFINTTLWKVGGLICFKFDSGPITINHDSSSPPANTVPFFLAENSNFDFKAGSTLTMIYDGTYWREIARMESSP